MSIGFELRVGGATWIQCRPLTDSWQSRTETGFRGWKLAARTGLHETLIRKARRISRGRGNAGQANSLSHYLTDVVLLPVQGRVRLDDDVLVRGLLEFVDQHGFASLQSFGDFRMHAQG